jgi:hypothetical protein
MQTTNTSVLARRVRISGEYSTLAHEAGWAIEGVFFIQTEGDHPDLAIHAEVSPDGINWRRRAETKLSSGESLTDLSIERFGNWLRLRITGATPETPARVLVHLNLKG